MLGYLLPQQIEEVLASELVGRIGCHADDETYVIPISYGYDGTYVYCHTTEGKKLQMMRKNPKICFQVDNMKDMGNWKSVLLQGQFEEVKEKEQRTAAMQVLVDRHLPIISSSKTHLGEHWPFSPDNLNDINGVVFRIAIHHKTGRFESSEASPSIPG
jgi:uncharacterized protein